MEVRLSNYRDAASEAFDALMDDEEYDEMFDDDEE